MYFKGPSLPEIFEMEPNKSTSFCRYPKVSTSTTPMANDIGLKPTVLVFARLLLAINHNA